MPSGPVPSGRSYSLKPPAVVTRPILGGFAANSLNHSAPSGPRGISVGPLGTVGMGNSVIVPSSARRPILLPFSSVNHIAPSGPGVIADGCAFGVGTVNSVTAAAGDAATRAAI